MIAEPLLRLRGVGKAFGRRGQQPGVVALEGIDLDLAPGEFLAVVGPSGSGKTTLLDLVAGFTAPTSGALTLRGRPVTGPGPDRAVVFQDHAVFPWYTALGNVAYGLRRQGVPRPEARRRAQEALAQVGLAGFAHAYPATLSGGMRQRVALARALVLQPDLLLLDEPFASLDQANRQRLQDELLSLWQRHGWAVIFVTHALAEAVYLSDRIVALQRPPLGLCACVSVDLPRPRARAGAALRGAVEAISDRVACPELDATSLE
jgi:NitT/TauT family transport system ATP-binding protein